MKRSKVRRAAALALAVVALTSSCSAFRVQSDVDIKRVSVNLTFGAKVDKPPSFSQQPDRFPPPAEFDDPRDNVKPPAPPPQPEIEICAPFPTTDTVRDVPQPRIDVEKHRPREGKYFWRWLMQIGDQRERDWIDYKDITDPEREGEQAIQYIVTDPAGGLKFHFLIDPEFEAERPQQYGFFLKWIDIPTKEYKGPWTEIKDKKGKVVGYQDPGTFRKSFRAVDPIQLSSFPFVSGEVTTDSSPDVAAKDSVENPAGGDPILRPSGNTIISRMTMGPDEIVEVCADLAKARKVTWDLRITGEYEVRMLGTFWLASAYGGYPIKEDYILTGDLLNGSFSSNMMRLDPERVI